jgi:hypothetical protein
VDKVVDDVHIKNAEDSLYSGAVFCRDEEAEWVRG